MASKEEGKIEREHAAEEERGSPEGEKEKGESSFQLL